MQRPARDENDADRTLARLLGNMNRVELELAQFAEGRSQTDAINRLAHKLAAGHEEALQELQQYAPDAGSGIGRSDDNNDSADNDSSGRDSSGRDSSGSGGLNWGKISREMANENLRAAKKELRDESGLDFDWTFIGQQKSLHCALHSELKVLRRYVSASLRKVLDEQLAMVEEHQKSIDRMIERLKEEEHRQLAGYSRNSDQDERRQSQAGRNRRNSDADQDYLEEMSFAETDFLTTARLTKDNDGHPILGVQLDHNQSDRATVKALRADGPAAQAGLQPGDTIVAVNGEEIDSPAALSKHLSRFHSGDQVQLVIDRSEFAAARIPLGQDSRGNQARSQQRSNGESRGQQGNNSQ